MLTLDADELRRRATRLASLCPGAVRAETLPGESAVGGGAFPGAVLPTTLVALDAGRSAPTAWRFGCVWVSHRWSPGSRSDRVLLDPRTLPEDAFPVVAGAIERALAS